MNKILIVSLLLLTGCGKDLYFRQSIKCNEYSAGDRPVCLKNEPFNRFYCEQRRPFPLVNLTLAICEDEKECRNVCSNEVK